MDLTKAKIWFVILSFATFALFAVSALREEDREWKKWQNEFFAMEQDRGIERDYSVQIRQIWDPSRGVTDRCITCHVGMEDPDVQNPYKQNPFKSHPQVAMMKKHPTTQLGCTVCHQGQGQATTTEAAHGWVEHWDWPMFKQRGGINFTQASCTKCHAPDRLPEGAEVLVAGLRPLGPARLQDLPHGPIRPAQRRHPGPGAQRPRQQDRERVRQHAQLRRGQGGQRA